MPTLSPIMNKFRPSLSTVNSAALKTAPTTQTYSAPAAGSVSLGGTGTTRTAAAPETYSAPQQGMSVTLASGPASLPIVDSGRPSGSMPAISSAPAVITAPVYSAPVIGAAPTPSVYSAAANPYTNNPYITSSLFSTEFQAPTINGKSAYDIQREGINAEAERTLQRRTEALQRQMATQGLSNSGIGLSAQLQQQQALATEQGKALSAVDIAQLGSAEEQAAAARERQMKVGQSYAELSMEEQKLAESARQFTDKTAFDAWAAQGGWTNDQINRVWQSGENDKTLNQAAQQFTDKMQFDTWAQKGNWSQQDIDRAWKTSENIRTQQFELTKLAESFGYDKVLETMRGSNQVALATLQGDIENNRLVLVDQINDTNIENKAISDSFYNRGLSGEVVPPSELEALKISNPMAYWAYMQGASGKSAADYEKGQKYIETYMSVLITNSAEYLGSEEFDDYVTNLYQTMGINIPSGQLPGQIPPGQTPPEGTPPEQTPPATLDINTPLLPNSTITVGHFVPIDGKQVFGPANLPEIETYMKRGADGVPLSEKEAQEKKDLFTRYQIAYSQPNYGDVVRFTVDDMLKFMKYQVYDLASTDKNMNMTNLLPRLMESWNWSANNGIIGKNEEAN
jgi:hypothetical protein